MPTLETKSDDGSAKQLGHESATDAADSVTAPSASASCINKSSSCRQSQETSSQNSANDCRTSVLIKKQMNEIDKEINRRIQNKNIKKVSSQKPVFLHGSFLQIFSVSSFAAGLVPNEWVQESSYWRTHSNVYILIAVNYTLINLSHHLPVFLVIKDTTFILWIFLNSILRWFPFCIAEIKANMFLLHNLSFCCSLVCPTLMICQLHCYRT